MLAGLSVLQWIFQASWGWGYARSGASSLTQAVCAMQITTQRLCLLPIDLLQPIVFFLFVSALRVAPEFIYGNPKPHRVSVPHLGKYIVAR